MLDEELKKIEYRTWQRIVIAQDFQVLAVSGRSAVGRRYSVERPVLASQPRQSNPHHHSPARSLARAGVL